MDKKIVIPANLCRSKVNFEANTIELSMTQETFDEYFAEPAPKDPEKPWYHLSAAALGTHVHQEIQQHMDRMHRHEMEKRFNQEVLGNWDSCPRDRLFTLGGTETGRTCTEDSTLTIEKLDEMREKLLDNKVDIKPRPFMLGNHGRLNDLQLQIMRDSSTLFYGGRGGGKNALIKESVERVLADIDFTKLEEYCMTDTHIADAFLRALDDSSDASVFAAGANLAESLNQPDNYIPPEPYPEDEDSSPIEEAFPDGKDDPMDMVRAFCK